MLCRFAKDLRTVDLGFAFLVISSGQLAPTTWHRYAILLIEVYFHIIRLPLGDQRISTVK